MSLFLRRIYTFKIHLNLRKLVLYLNHLLISSLEFTADEMMATVQFVRLRWISRLETRIRKTDILENPSQYMSQSRDTYILFFTTTFLSPTPTVKVIYIPYHHFQATLIYNLSTPLIYEAITVQLQTQTPAITFTELSIYHFTNNLT